MLSANTSQILSCKHAVQLLRMFSWLFAQRALFNSLYQAWGLLTGLHFNTSLFLQRKQQELFLFVCRQWWGMKTALLNTFRSWTSTPCLVFTQALKPNTLSHSVPHSHFSLRLCVCVCVRVPGLGAWGREDGWVGVGGVGQVPLLQQNVPRKRSSEFLRRFRWPVVQVWHPEMGR